ncbi:MAG: hypothetical protein VYE68_16535 [Acidobacteriota bacterium]|nr:hypothetical protein [Acidobacteriota bacterium]
MRSLGVYALVLALGCGTAPPEEDPRSILPAEPTTVAVSADWFNDSVSFLDADTLVATDGTRDSALVETINLSPSGRLPLVLDATEDGRHAVVLLSPGVIAFVGDRVGIASEDVPEGGNAIVLLDLTTRQPVATVPTDDIPIMVAIDDPRQQVFVSFFGGAPPAMGSIGVYDLNSLREITRIEVAPFVEGLALNDAGTRGAVIGATAGLHLFDPDDPANTLSSTPLRLADDSSGVAFVAGTDRVVVANSVNPSNYVVVDATDLDNPAVVDEGAELDGVPYMVAAVPTRPEVVMPVTADRGIRLLHLDLSATPGRVLHDVQVDDIVTFPQAITVDPTGRYAFVGAAASRELIIFDLETGAVHRRTWLNELGPTSLAVAP